MSMLGRIFCEIRRFQAVPYNLEMVPFLQEYLLNLKHLDEESLWTNSKKCEPSATSVDGAP